MHKKIKRNFIFVLLSVFGTVCAQPYAPAAGSPGSTAMHKDSSAFVNWATSSRVIRGFQDISNPQLGLASVGDSSMATGKAQTNGVVSLGDGGTTVCTFDQALRNGPGPDFAVFENGFNDSFLELAFVEVSSDGVNFVRFKAHSLSDTSNQYGNNATMDPTKINNLAGKYRAGYGTPFDLQELAGTPNLNINFITHIKVIDVVGSLQRSFASFDGFGNKINDPWPTPFPSSGFDLDAIGVIYENQSADISENNLTKKVIIYPNPVDLNGMLSVEVDDEILEIKLIGNNGKLLLKSNSLILNLSGIDAGFYFLQIQCKDRSWVEKVCVF